METIKVLKKDRVIPSGYQDLTVKQFIRLYHIDPSKEEEFIAAMLNMEVEELRKSRIPNIDLKVMPKLAWYREGITFQGSTHPKVVTINGKKLKVPKDLGYETYGQKIALSNKALEEGMTRIDLIPYALAYYFYPQYSEEEFDDQKAVEFMNEFVMDLPILEVHQIADFFLRSLEDWMNKKIISLMENIPMKKYKRVSEILKNSKSSKR